VSGKPKTKKSKKKKKKKKKEGEKNHQHTPTTPNPKHTNLTKKTSIVTLRKKQGGTRDIGKDDCGGRLGMGLKA